MLTKPSRDASSSPASREPPVPSLNRGFSAPIKLVANLIAPTICVSSPRTTAIRSTAGRRCRRWRCALLVDNVAALRTGGAARAGRRPARCARRDPRRRDARARLRRARAHAAERGRHRARDRPRRRSRRHLRGARRVARGDRRASRAARCSTTIAGCSKTRTLPARTPRAPDGARCSNACLDLLAATRRARRDRARGAPIPGRRQHDRPHGGAGDALAAATCRSARPRSTISTRAMRDDPLIIDKWFSLQAIIPEPGDARPREGAHRASGLLVRQSRTACAR